jgi:hypothetical protein
MLSQIDEYEELIEKFPDLSVINLFILILFNYILFIE